MNKDALLATIIGFGIGLIITGVLLLGPGLLKNFPKFNFSLPKVTQKTSPTPTPLIAPSSLTIDNPLPEAIETTEELLVSGKTIAGALVVIQGIKDEVVATGSADGTYAGKITLSEGKNVITVTSYNRDNEFTQTVTAYFTPEKL